MSKPRSKGIYKALLTQAGLAAPVAVVLENTLLLSGADIVWSRSVAGSYKATLVGAFKDNKTFGYAGQQGIDGIFLDFDKGVTDDTIDLKTTNSAGLPTDDRLVDTPVLIEVFE